MPPGRGPTPPPRPAPPLRPAIPQESYDLYVAYPCVTEDDVRRIVGGEGEQYMELENLYTRILLLTPALSTRFKDYARGGHPRYGGGYKSLSHRRGGGKTPYTAAVIEPALGQLVALGLYPPRIALDILPPMSFLLQFRFTLSGPFMSRDDETFYIHENPLSKEAVFKVPYVRPSSWKGILRQAAASLPDARPGDVEPLFGNPREAEVGQRGRLHFYPTYFDALDLEMINPHSRVTRAGTTPIVMEVVPAGAAGFFTLLYTPFDLIGLAPDSRPVRQEVARDIVLTARAVVAMLREQGFSAKRNRGFGLAEEQISGDSRGGQLVINGFPYPKTTFRILDDLLRLAQELARQLLPG